MLSAGARFSYPCQYKHEKKVANLFDAGGALLSIDGLPLGVALGGIDVDVAPRVDGVRRIAESHWAQGEES